MLTTASRPTVDMPALSALMRREGLEPTPDLCLEPLPGGRSHPRYRVLGARRLCALRRKPVGALLPSAHAIGRAYRVMKALAGSGMPVPETYLYSADTSIVGTPFYLMEFLDSRVMLDPARRHDVGAVG